MPPLPEEPQFVKNITSLQKLLAGVAVSMFFTVWVTGFDFVKDIFKPDFIKLLTWLRVAITLSGIAITSVVGYPQIMRMINWFVQNYELYQEMSALKRKNTDKKMRDE